MKLSWERMEWKSLAAGVNPATLDAATSSTNWMTPKTHGQMAAFLMAWGRNDAGQLGIGSATVRRLPVRTDG
jgi:hypothetical protein